MNSPVEPGPLDADKLKDQAITLGKMASHPEFLAVLKEIQDAPEADRLKTAERLATVDNLRQRGVPIPDEFRLTTRYFENPTQSILSSVQVDTVRPPGADDDDFVAGVTVCGSVGYIVCGSVGGQTLEQ
ncbi:hypothetical protein [Mycolicibacterium sp. 624]|uniref:hypothetical protein n=1 Tax=Mycolicibacterium sp. 624 TaxID=3156314 RepID=UPI003396B147